MAIEYAPLFALETQFQSKDGRNNTGGWLKVFLAATDDPATTYSDYNGTRNPERIVLDDDGRAVVICDKSKAYRLEVYGIDGALLWTEEPVYCSGTGGGGVSITKVVSTDGSISVDKNVAGSTTTYDLGLAPSSDEFLEWIKCSEEDCGATWYPVFQDGTMETEAGQGVKVHKGHLYHFTNSFTVDPNGTGVNYDTFRVTMYCGDVEVDMREFEIDSSLNDQVLCEFSRDVVPTEDSHVYFKLTIPSTCEVTGEVQCHRVYSGINAVPDTCATKQWVQETFDYNLSSKVDYSAIGLDGLGQVTGINGSAIAGGLDSATVSSIASSVASAYTESALAPIAPWSADFSSISSKVDKSALTAYQPVSAMGAYAPRGYVNAIVSRKLDTTASSLFLTGLPDDLATTGDIASAVSGKLDRSASSTWYPLTGNPSGFLTAHQSLAGYATQQYVDSSVSSKLDTTAFASASAGFAPTGDYAYNSSLSAYIPASASGAFQPSGNYQPSGDYAFNSSLSSKLDASASGNFVANSATTSWIPYSALDYSGTAISGIGGSSLAGMGGGADYTGVYPVNVDNETREISLDSMPLVTDSSMTAYNSAGSSVIGVNMDILSGKLDVTAFNSGDFYTTANESGFVNGAYVESAISGKQDTLAFDWAADSSISSINGSALAGGAAITAISYDTTTQETSVVTATGIGISDSSSVSSIGFSDGSYRPIEASVITVGATQHNTGREYTLKFSPSASMWTTSDVATGIFSPLKWGTGAGLFMDAGYFKGFVKGNELFVSNTFKQRAAQLEVDHLGLSSNGGSSKADLYNSALNIVNSARSTAILSQTGLTVKYSSQLSGNFDYAGMYFSNGSARPYNIGIDSTGANFYIATAQNGFERIYASSIQGWNAKLDGSASSSFYTTANESGFVDSAYVTGAITGKQDTLAFGYNAANQISSIDGSALGGMDEAAVSSIASSYAESAASGKLDTTAFNSGDFYTTSNPSGFITGVDLTPYQPTSAMSAYATTAYVTSGLSGKENVFSAGTGLEFVQSGSDRVLQVEAPVDIVAGPGIRIDNPDGNTLRVSTVENYGKELYVHTTVPYTDVDAVFTLSEPVTNFERIRVESWNREFQQYQATYEFTIAGSTTSTVFVMSMDHSESTSNIQRLNMRFSYNSDGNLVDKGHILFFGNGNSSASGNQRGLGIHRVVGIHRIASN